MSERTPVRPGPRTVGGHAIIDRVKWRIRLPKDPAQRTLALAIVTSVLFHLFLIVPFVVIPGFLQPAQYIKRGEPLMVEMNERRALMDVLATVWPDYEICWAYDGTEEIAGYVGASLSRT